jgi:polysaccharide deacetylase family protein (PEP-CTERM system associated)
VSNNALSVDLEEWFHVSNFEGLIQPERWDELPSRVADPTHRLLDAFDATASRATFFVLGWIAERQPGLAREIVKRGHEIACHGHRHERVHRLGPERFREDLRRARRAIEDACGVAVRGYRAPSFSIDRSSLWALRILAEEGFAFDSSIFPVRHPRYGIPDFPRQPLRLDLGDGVSIAEFPLTTWRIGGWNVPMAGGAYLRLAPGALFAWAFGRLARSERPTVLYLHPWEVDPEQPRQRVSWRIRLNHYLGLRSMEGRVRYLLERHRFEPIGVVLERLEARGELPREAPAVRDASPRRST